MITLWAHEGDVGTVVEITITGADEAAKDVSGATTKTIKFAKPSGTVDSQTAAFTTDGTDGKIRYVTTAPDLDELGAWEVQGFVSGSGFSWHTMTGRLIVRDARGV